MKNTIEITMPFASSEFSEIWITYKEYRTKVHNQYISSHAEFAMLERLTELSGNDECKAIEMLKFFISYGFKSIFIPSAELLHEATKKKGVTV